MFSLSWLPRGANGLLSPIVAAILALVGALGMEAEPDSPAGAPQEQTVSASQHGTSESSGDWPEVKTPAGEDLVGGTLQAWDRQKQTGPNNLQIAFSGQDRSCTPYRVEVQENATAVRVDLYAGASRPGTGAPSADPAVCEDGQMSYYIEVETKSPIGKREIVQQF